MDMRIPPLEIEILLEANPLKAIILVRRLAVEHQITSLDKCNIKQIISETPIY